MQEPSDQDALAQRKERMRESVEGVGDGLETIEADLELQEMTEGPTKNLIRFELEQLLCSSKLMKASLGRLRAALVDHYGLTS